MFKEIFFYNLNTPPPPFSNTTTSSSFLALSLPSIRFPCQPLPWDRMRIAEVGKLKPFHNMSNNGGIQDAREGERERVRGRFSTGRKKLSHHQIGYSEWRDAGVGAVEGGRGGRGSGWQDLAAGARWRCFH